MINFSKIKNPHILIYGNQSGIIQSILDFDYLCGKGHPSVYAIVGVQQKICRYFFGQKEILIKGYHDISDVPASIREKVTLVGVMQSGRRARECVEKSVESLPNLKAGFLFAEGVNEQDALSMRKLSLAHDIAIFGPASVGMLVGGEWKLGAIGGTMPEQIASSGTIQAGDVVVVSTSGGIVNELINMVAMTGSRVAYAAAIGGERYPIAKPVDVFKQALDDKNVRAIIYFGELGGNDEELIADLYKKSKSKKTCIAYVAGSIGEHFDTPQQFGHAKSMAHSEAETASYKRKLLADAGLHSAASFSDFENAIGKLGEKSKAGPLPKNDIPEPRMKALFVDNISSEGDDEVVRILGEDLTGFVSGRSLSEIALAMFLGKKDSSKTLKKFFDTVLKLLVDHGPQVSGAVNTMITARAGKDLTASLASGILTIGPRFGGAIDQAADNWLTAAKDGESAYDFVERYAKNKNYIPGIGHKKYRTDNPDPRVAMLRDQFDEGGEYITFAKDVENITSAKKAQLILNVDGAIGALLIDILKKHESMTDKEIKDLLDTGFCNALFVLARSVGFIAHFLEQKRIDEGLFRLPNDQISSFE